MTLLLEFFVGLSAYLMVILGGLSLISVILIPIWLVLNKVLYPRVQGATYFVSYIRNRKQFIAWKKSVK
ncbi:hypothetical protein ANABIO32_02520 [Rossellomorea marisflavi]|nr:hypothetical protein ANABIO32_02520 [Rossellomorea marisflavi]